MLLKRCSSPVDRTSAALHANRERKIMLAQPPHGQHASPSLFFLRLGPQNAPHLVQLYLRLESNPALSRWLDGLHLYGRPNHPSSFCLLHRCLSRSTLLPNKNFPYRKQPSKHLLPKNSQHRTHLLQLVHDLGWTDLRGNECYGVGVRLLLCVPGWPLHVEYGVAPVEHVDGECSDYWGCDGVC